MGAAGRGDDRPMEPEMTVPMAAQSAVLVSVPEAEPAVSRYRARLDRAGAWGVPAHVTILYPFVAPPRLRLPPWQPWREQWRSSRRSTAGSPPSGGSGRMSCGSHRGLLGGSVL